MHDDGNERRERRDPRPGWLRAQDALLRALRERLGRFDDERLGRVKNLGGGVSREGWVASLDLASPQPGWDAVVALVPHDPPTLPLGEENTSVRREFALLECLATRKLPFDLPAPIACVPSPAGDVLVITFVDGMPLADARGRWTLENPGDRLATLAAAIHALDGADLRKLLGPPEDCRRVAERAIHATFRDHPVSGPLAKAKEWLEHHLPPAEPTVFVHGDLFPQNLRLAWEGDRLGVIDWEYAGFHDPAYDFAVAGRGPKSPLREPGPLRALLDAYARAGGRHVPVERVRFWALLGAARNALWALGEGRHPDDAAFGELKGTLKRALQDAP